MSLGRRFVGVAAKALDRAVVSAVHLREARAQAARHGLSADKRLGVLEAAAEAYAPALEGDAAGFFSPPEAAPVTEVRVSALRSRPSDPDAGTFELSWPSDEPAWLPAMRDPLRARRENLTARARLLSGGAGRPAVVCIHGYLGGHYAIEARKFPVDWFFSHGLDVALPVLPHHAVRGARGGGPPPFPSADPALTNEGFRQVIRDLRVLITHLRARGAPWVGVVGTSLGGYTTALLATLERDLAFAVPVVPLASVADFARDHGELGAGEGAATLHAAFERANAVVSPYTRPSLVAPERAFVIGADYDAITGVGHAERIAGHLDARLDVCGGGHLLQLWRPPLKQGLAAILGQLHGRAPAR